MIIEYARSFDQNFAKHSVELQAKARQTVAMFIDCYAAKHFPKGLRVHKCGPFISISFTMKHRIFVLPIPDGIKFVFIGDHEDADRYLGKN